MKWIKIIVCLGLAAAAVFFVSGTLRSGEPTAAAVTQEAALPSPAPQASATPKPSKTPAPAATPTPAPTKTPFEELAPTVNMTFEELVGDNGNMNMPKGYPAANTYRLVVDLANQVVAAYEKDEDGEYTVPVRYMLCSSGAKGNTPRGVFKMDKYKVRWGNFSSSNCAGQYWSQIRGRIYFHSILYDKTNASTYRKSAFSNIGKAVSHGCIRLLVPDARWVFYHIGYGTEVEIRRGDKEDPEMSEIREKLLVVRNKLPKTRVKLTPGKIPDTDNWKIADLPLELPYKKGTPA